jgi:MarR family 2-MHQ and catechol resistance regulon transcriptional repressor
VPEDRRESYYHHRVRKSGPQYEGFDLLSAEISLSFLYTYDIFQQCAARYMADYGLSKSSFNVLMLLHHGPPEGMQLHDLGDLLLVSRANITGLIDHLEQKGYVKRVIDPHDRRARYARITKKGEALLEELIPVHYQNTKALLQDLTTEEKETLLKLLTKTRASLTAHAHVCAGQRSVACQTVQE